MTAPIIGITCSLDDRDVRLRRAYTLAVQNAGGVPILLPPPGPEHLRDSLARYLDLCRGFVLTGGDDPATESYGEPTHPAATLVHPDRQRFEEALLDALRADPPCPAPVLGICLGMQMMALRAGGALHQHLPEVLASAADHAADHLHPIAPEPGAPIAAGTVPSWHHQAVRDPGRLRIIARAPDGVIEAIDDPSRTFYLGVQWHPERTSHDPLGAAIFRSLVRAAGASMESMHIAQ